MSNIGVRGEIQHAVNGTWQFVMAITGFDRRDEAEQFADVVTNAVVSHIKANGGVTTVIEREERAPSGLIVPSVSQKFAS